MLRCGCLHQDVIAISLKYHWNYSPRCVRLTTSTQQSMSHISHTERTKHTFNFHVGEKEKVPLSGHKDKNDWFILESTWNHIFIHLVNCQCRKWCIFHSAPVNCHIHCFQVPVTVWWTETKTTKRRPCVFQVFSLQVCSILPTPPKTTKARWHSALCQTATALRCETALSSLYLFFKQEQSCTLRDSRREVQLGSLQLFGDLPGYSSTGNTMYVFPAAVWVSFRSTCCSEAFPLASPWSESPVSQSAQCPHPSLSLCLSPPALLIPNENLLCS